MTSMIQRHPIDKTKTFHIGVVKKVVYRDESKPFAILALTDERIVKGNFLADQFENNNVWRFHGRWQDDPVRGPNFAADTFTLESVRGEYGLMEYLERLELPLTRKQIRSIYKEYGDNTFQILRDSPEEVAQTSANWAKDQISIESAKEISEILIAEKDTATAKQDLFQLFQRRGFNSKTVERCIRKWGKNAPAMIRDNPFILMELPSCGFKRCDKIWHELGHDPKDLRRQIACLAWVLSQDRIGNTWQLVDDIEERFHAQIPDGDVIAAIKYGLTIRALDKLRDDEGNLYLARYRDSIAEQTIASALHSLNSVPTRWPVDAVQASQVEGDGLPSEHQVGQLRVATQKPVGKLLGGPGTGKTHSLGYLLREVANRIGSDRIGAIAPTGKAGQRMREALSRSGLDIDTKTIHSFLKLGVDDDDSGNETDGPVGYAQSDVDVVIVDETSMCDTPLMARLLRSLPRGTHVLFIGDSHQLPPVGHGAPLRDFITAKVPYGELTEVRRNSGTIVRACAAIKTGQPIQFDESPDLDAGDYPRNLVNIDTRDESETAQVLEDLLMSVKGFDRVWETQVIVGRNKGGEIARTEINNRLQRLLNTDGRTCGTNPFRVNDKIICLKNQKLQAVSSGSFFGSNAAEIAAEAKNYYPQRDENNQPITVFVANGEVGRVVAISENQLVAKFTGKDELVRVPVGVKKHVAEDEDDEAKSDSGRGCSFDLAYAVTCHKLQGSEAPFCIILADERANLIAGREWWYTAISRASRLCIVIGSASTVAKQCLRQTLNLRKTFLAERIIESQTEKDSSPMGEYT
jgi:exodeoxyribonuclease V alpha subunit